MNLIIFLLIYFLFIFFIKMISCKAFIQDDSLGDQNKFFQITDETYGIHANEEFVIGE